MSLNEMTNENIFIVIFSKMNFKIKTLPITKIVEHLIYIFVCLVRTMY